ncbi:MAG: hypothetical protein V4538_17400 [Bacteroidota bacterium]
MIMNKSKSLFAIIILLVFTQCKDDLNIAEYVQFYNKKDNGLTQSVQQDSTVYAISIRSREYMALMNIGPDAMHLSKEELKKQIEETEDFTYIFFKIQNDGLIIKKDSVEKIDQINYFQSGVLNDVYLINKGNKIYPCLSTYISSNNMVNEHTLILAFPVPFSEIESKPEFIVNKSTYFTKNISIPLPIKNKNTLPELSF